MGFIKEFNDFLKMGKGKVTQTAEKYSDRVVTDPGIAIEHLKLAKSYEKRGEVEKALQEYLLTAESFSRNGRDPEALALYKHILKTKPSMHKIRLKITKLYRKMGQLENAYSVYTQLVRAYNKEGNEAKAAEVMCLMAELSMHEISKEKEAQTPLGGSHLPEPSKEIATSGNIPQSQPSVEEDGGTTFDLGAELETNQPMEVKGFNKTTGEKTYGFKEILKELKATNVAGNSFPDFYYHMGVACRQMGDIDEAIEQFKVALEKGQNPCGAAHMLGRCFWDKGLREEARRLYERALQVRGISQEKIREIKDELALLAGEERRF
jgi:tetratricopeptide (TPR) repeat protein